MKLYTKIIGALLCLVLLFTGIAPTFQNGKTTPVVRSMELSDNFLSSDAMFEAFDSYNLTVENNVATFEGLSTFTWSDFDDVDLVSESDADSVATLKFTSEFDYNTGISTLNLVLVGDTETEILETVYGVALITDAGEVDVAYEIDGEIVFLSELRNAGMIDNIGLFSKIKNVVKNVATAVANDVTKKAETAIKVLSTSNGAIGTAVTLVACAAVGAVCAFIPGGQLVTVGCATIAGAIVGGVGFNLTAKAAQQQNSSITDEDISTYTSLGVEVGMTVSVATCKAATSIIEANKAAKAAKITGQWEKVNESMSDASREYQKYITGHENEAFVQNGVKFDGVLDGKLIDTKNHYSQFVDKSSGKFFDWFSGKDGLVDEATRQITAANGAPIQWYFSEEASLNAVKELFKGTEAEVIELILKVMG